MTKRLQAVLAALPLLLGATPAPAASVTYNFITGPAFVGRFPGADGLWGTADDTAAPGTNTIGAASFSYESGAYINYFQGSFALSPTQTPGQYTFTAVNITDESNRTGTLDTSQTNVVTAPDIFHFTSDFYLTGTLAGHNIGVNGYSLYNKAGFNDAAIFGDSGLTADFTFLESQLPSNWTQVNLEFLKQGTNPYPQFGTIAAHFTTDLSVLPAPLPAAIYMLVSALVGLVAMSRRDARTAC